MLIRTSRPSDPSPSEITSEAVYADRRRFLRLAGGATLATLLTAPRPAPAGVTGTPVDPTLGPLAPSVFSTDEDRTSFEDVTHYNNFYEFGADKADPARLAHTLEPRPWTVVVDGNAGKPRTFAIDDMLKLAPLEERIYRLRCVEGWSMVIPWVGFPLAELLKRVEPESSAKYVEFTSLHDPRRMPGQRVPLLDWPYVEGLRLDEALHPLSILAVGLYGKPLPNQNGAPIRLVVPWKYGFKSIKSVVRIRLTETQPISSWMKAGPREYGFFANVNPEVDHPRWSQAKERRIGDFLKRPTLPFNGYAEQVASLYRGMDLRTYF